MICRPFAYFEPALLRAVQPAPQPLSPPLLTPSDAPIVVKVERVSAQLAWGDGTEPTKRCCAPGCGDKIKTSSDDETMLRLTWSNDDVTYLEEGCVEWFEDGYTDYRGGHGPLPAISA